MWKQQLLRQDIGILGVAQGIKGHRSPSWVHSSVWWSLCTLQAVAVQSLLWALASQRQPPHGMGQTPNPHDQVRTCQRGIVGSCYSLSPYLSCSSQSEVKTALQHPACSHLPCVSRDVGTRRDFQGKTPLHPECLPSLLSVELSLIYQGKG